MKEHMIPLSVPNLKGNELQYVSSAVETEWVSTVGPYVTEFESNLAAYVRAPAAVACQSGTAGLHVALQLCGVTSDDIVLVPTLTFIAAVNPVRYIGAEPIFMDCDDTLCLDTIKLETFCSEECNIRNGKLIHLTTKKCVRAVVVVHVFGNMAGMTRIMDIASRYHLKVVEDATEALGTHYMGGVMNNAYAGTIGDMGVYSFNGNKIITTGGGGMIVSHDSAKLQHARHLTTQAKSDPINFKHDEIGYNYRMTNLQAALGVAQMEQLEGFIRTKRENYTHYAKLLATVPHLRFLPFVADARCNYWFYSLYLEKGFPLTRDELISTLGEEHIQTRPIWGLIHEQVPYMEARTYLIEKAVQYERRVVNLPCSTSLTKEQIEIVAKAVKCIG